MMGSGRTSCCIPGCRCSTKHAFYEWICSKHWRLVPKETRVVYARVKRLHRRGRKSTAAVWRIWDRCKRYATEANFMGFP
jgi:hypothetical protein